MARLRDQQPVGAAVERSEEPPRLLAGRLLGVVVRHGIQETGNAGRIDGLDARIEAGIGNDRALGPGDPAVAAECDLPAEAPAIAFAAAFGSKLTAPIDAP
jgi:hypothetical protein